MKSCFFQRTQRGAGLPSELYGGDVQTECTALFCAFRGGKQCAATAFRS